MQRERHTRPVIVPDVEHVIVIRHNRACTTMPTHTLSPDAFACATRCVLYLLCALWSDRCGRHSPCAAGRPAWDQDANQQRQQHDKPPRHTTDAQQPTNTTLGTAGHLLVLRLEREVCVERRVGELVHTARVGVLTPTNQHAHVHTSRLFRNAHSRVVVCWLGVNSFLPCRCCSWRQSWQTPTRSERPDDTTTTQQHERGVQQST